MGVWWRKVSNKIFVVGLGRFFYKKYTLYKKFFVYL